MTRVSRLRLNTLYRACRDARTAVGNSLPIGLRFNREALIGMCAVVACETARQLELHGRRPRVEYRLGVAVHPVHGFMCPIHHLWVTCDGYIVDGTSKQLGGPLAYVSRERDAAFWNYKAARSWRTTEGVARFIRKLGWSGPSAALLVQERERAA